MGRPRTPSNVLALRGSFKNHPERAADRAGEPDADDDIGDPPDWFSAEEFMCWVEITAIAHPGTLSHGDRLIVEHGAQLLATLRANRWQVHPTLLIRWEAFLSKLGLTPADRSRVKVRKAAPDADPLDEFEAAG